MHLASKISRLCIRHIYHEANKCVDRLVKLGLQCFSKKKKLGLQQSLDFVIHSSPPMDIIASLKADCQEILLTGSTLILVFLFSCFNDIHFTKKKMLSLVTKTSI